MDRNRILIVEDDADIRGGVEIYLKNQGYEVCQAQDGIEGLDRIEKGDIDLAIVDIMMPRMDGITMMMKVREKGYDFPVIMLSAKSEEVDKIMGLNMGADDYITKPFTPLELLARVNSHLRRYNRYREALSQTEPEKDTYHVIGGIELNEETVEVFVDGNPVRLTPIEFKILLLLMKNPGRVFSADEIYERIWNEKAINTDTIMVHIRKIREKIEIDPKNPIRKHGVMEIYMSGTSILGHIQIIPLTEPLQMCLLMLLQEARRLLNRYMNSGKIRLLSLAICGPLPTS